MYIICNLCFHLGHFTLPCWDITSIESIWHLLHVCGCYVVVLLMCSEYKHHCKFNNEYNWEGLLNGVEMFFWFYLLWHLHRGLNFETWNDNLCDFLARLYNLHNNPMTKSVCEVESAHNKVVTCSYANQVEKAYYCRMPYLNHNLSPFVFKVHPHHAIFIGERLCTSPKLSSCEPHLHTHSSHLKIYWKKNPPNLFSSFFNNVQYICPMEIILGNSHWVAHI